MKRYFVLAAAITIGVAGCTTYQPERDTTQPGKLRKSAFQDGSDWYMLSTVIDAPYEAGHTFPGEAGDMNRIRWVVEEDTLYAFQTYEFIKDAEYQEQNGGIGEPTAAYAIQGHFDVWNQYNPVTGEQMPVKYEAKERPWWERDWIRVDWSKNQIDSFNWMFSQFCLMDGTIKKDPVAYMPTSPTDPEQFYVARRDAEQADGWQNFHGWQAIEEASADGFDYIDVVNREFVHVNIGALFTGNYDPSCYPSDTLALSGGQQITYRHSFMKVAPSEFQPVYHPDAAFEKFGFFRTEREVYDPARGITDFKEYHANIWNIWDDIVADNGTVIPITQRGIKPITFYYNAEETLESTKACAAGGPCIDYVDDALYDVVADQWNEAFRDVLRGHGHPEAETAIVFQAKKVEFVEIDQDGDGEADVTRPRQNIGDIRYSFMWNHDKVSASSPLGYGPAFVDPLTGEIIAANANFYGGALRNMFGYLGDLYDVTKGNVTELEIMTGENVRDYFANLGNATMPPSLPEVDLEALQAFKDMVGQGRADFTNPANLDLKQLDLRRNLNELQRTNPSSLARRMPAIGTQIERDLISPDMLALLGEDPNTPLTDDVLDRVSPLRANSRWRRDFLKWEKFWSSRNVLWADTFFQDLSLDRLIQVAEEELAAEGKPTDKHYVIEKILKYTFVGTQAHEVGHTVGLRHNFEGTFDEENYFSEYWDIRDPNGANLPDIDWYSNAFQQYDADSNGVLDQTELAAFDADRIARKREQERAGTDFYQYSSIMDYSHHFYYNDIAGLGKYDHAALKFGYGSNIEIYSDDQNRFDPADVDAAGGWDSFKFKKLNRVDVPYYMGGERCNSNDECPYFFHEVAPQRCRAQLGHGAPLTNGTEEDLGVCTSIHFELATLKRANRIDYPDYRFCSDERRNDKPYCNVYDEGKSAVEIVENLIESYDKNYIFNNFRRYRGETFQPYYYYRRIWGRYFVPLGIIYQSLLYNLYYTRGYAENTGPGGMLDAFLASRIAMNFFSKVLATPDVGTFYEWAPGTTLEGSYTESCEDYGPDTVCVPLGVGKHLWTAMETGYYGQIYRYARIGNYFDKLFAIEALTTRDWGLPSANDETYPINFYDGFPDEMIELFSGIIGDHSEDWGPVVTSMDGNTVSGIEYRDWWKGGFWGGPSMEFQGLESVTGEPKEYTHTGPILDATGSIYVRLDALIYALFDFPVFFDMSFPEYVQLYAYGLPSAHADEARIQQAEQDGELISYVSPDRQMMYVVPATENNRSIFWNVLVKAKAQQQYLEELRSYDGVAPVGFMSLPENVVCTRIYGAETDDECLVEMEDYLEDELLDQDSFLRQAVDYLSILGYRTQ